MVLRLEKRPLFSWRQMVPVLFTAQNSPLTEGELPFEKLPAVISCLIFDPAAEVLVEPVYKVQQRPVWSSCHPSTSTVRDPEAASLNHIHRGATPLMGVIRRYADFVVSIAPTYAATVQFEQIHHGGTETLRKGIIGDYAE